MHALVTLPFKIALRLISLLTALAVGVVKLCGRAVALLVGVALITLGVLMSFTVVGAVPGVPLAVFGAILVFKVAL